MVREGSSNVGVPLPAMIAWPLLAAGLAALLWLAFHAGRPAAAPHVVSVGPRIEDVRRIAKLAVLRVQVADVIEGTTRGAKALVLVKGDADIAIDLEQIELADRDDDKRTATLVIPTPHPERPRVDHERTKIYELQETGLAAINPFADPRKVLLEDCMRAAQAAVEKAVQSPDFTVQAKQQAETLLGAYLKQVEWNVTARWK